MKPGLKRTLYLIGSLVLLVLLTWLGVALFLLASSDDQDADLFLVAFLLIGASLVAAVVHLAAVVVYLLRSTERTARWALGTRAGNQAASWLGTLALGLALGSSNTELGAYASMICIISLFLSWTMMAFSTGIRRHILDQRQAEDFRRYAREILALEEHDLREIRERLARLEAGAPVDNS